MRQPTLLFLTFFLTIFLNLSLLPSNLCDSKSRSHPNLDCVCREPVLLYVIYLSVYIVTVCLYLCMCRVLHTKSSRRSRSHRIHGPIGLWSDHQHKSHRLLPLLLRRVQFFVICSQNHDDARDQMSSLWEYESVTSIPLSSVSTVVVLLVVSEPSSSKRVPVVASHAVAAQLSEFVCVLHVCDLSLPWMMLLLLVLCSWVKFFV